jgi:hypothetical protein
MSGRSRLLTSEPTNLCAEIYGFMTAKLFKILYNGKRVPDQTSRHEKKQSTQRDRL